MPGIFAQKSDLSGIFHCFIVGKCRSNIVMKKYIFLIAGIMFLILGAIAAVNISAKTMPDDCVEDGSCCEDVNNCRCG
jgi:hypothetical protein